MNPVRMNPVLFRLYLFCFHLQLSLVAKAVTTTGFKTHFTRTGYNKYKHKCPCCKSVNVERELQLETRNTPNSRVKKWGKILKLYMVFVFRSCIDCKKVWLCNSYPKYFSPRRLELTIKEDPDCLVFKEELFVKTGLRRQSQPGLRNIVSLPVILAKPSIDALLPFEHFVLPSKRHINSDKSLLIIGPPDMTDYHRQN